MTEENQVQVEEQPVYEWIRNLLDVPIRFRLTPKGDSRFGKAIELKPRGWRGDLASVTEDERKDERYLDNFEYGLFEELTADEAYDIRYKQNINRQAQRHPAKAVIANQLMENQGQMEVVYDDPESRAVVVAHDLSSDQPGTRRDVNIQRVAAPGSVEQPIPGTGPEKAPEGDTEAERDAVARQKGTQGPSAGLGNLKVTVDPVQKG